mmetsp:Transcript_21602/g.18623  ORF Transcript_21602/g.18623 Transcript_21602/m.18623 type:complete len:89 (-) Transcript_21602:335-601(-)|eukprot:CAMPEP_0114584072 /NCGR_PEP_ID=MMETSP0125-20121206/7789_1 /TAXON_ID=485358 ORGANISM="Aristerostoma sp., Strain ATCC 50986" /NCGR_SAMPLE_ID=MMETSP0125 /ASSEMBLY_ACC=CAM_ASM_000245 /LENGTH=88 /DNA_ID=CAMNT_0001778131 /DNA_START=1490 /DNA_END=1756 /DNA_ORIENTATION=+
MIYSDEELPTKENEGASDEEDEEVRLKKLKYHFYGQVKGGKVKGGHRARQFKSPVAKFKQVKSKLGDYAKYQKYRNYSNKDGGSPTNG